MEREGLGEGGRRRVRRRDKREGAGVREVGDRGGRSEKGRCISSSIIALLAF